MEFPSRWKMSNVHGNDKQDISGSPSRVWDVTLSSVESPALLSPHEKTRVL